MTNEQDEDGHITTIERYNHIVIKLKNGENITILQTRGTGLDGKNLNLLIASLKQFINCGDNL